MFEIFCFVHTARKFQVCKQTPCKIKIYLPLIKFRYNARSDWLKERALSEYRARSDEGGPISVSASAF